MSQYHRVSTASRKGAGKGDDASYRHSWRSYRGGIPRLTLQLKPCFTTVPLPRAAFLAHPHPLSFYSLNCSPSVEVTVAHHIAILHEICLSFPTQIFPVSPPFTFTHSFPMVPISSPKSSLLLTATFAHIHAVFSSHTLCITIFEA